MRVTSKVSDDQPCLHCGRWVVRGVTVDALVELQGKILLMQRAEDPFKNHWALPGGWVEKNQTTTEAAQVELWQETRIRGVNPRLIGVFDDPHRHPQGAISIAYAFDLEGNTVPVIGDPKEVLQVKWWDIDELPHLAFDHAQIITAFLGMR